MTRIKADLSIDTKGTACPMPVLNTKMALNKMATGEILEVVADDHGSESDIPALIRRLGHELIDLTRHGDAYFFLIRKI